MKMAFLQRLSKDLKSLKRSLTKQKNINRLPIYDFKTGTLFWP